MAATRQPVAVSPGTPGLLPKATDVVVFLGDSLTDGCTYAQLLRKPHLFPVAHGAGNRMFSWDSIF
jgi:hypothetical protein